jgi:hypothetical protein
VDRGIRYCGLNTTMRAWFERGEISFANFGALQRWITSELKDEFERSLDAVPPVATIIPKHEPPSKGAADRSATTLGTYSSSQPAAESPRPEPFFGRVIIFAIKQLARTYGLDVISVEDAIVGAIASNLASRGEQPCEAVFDEFFAGPFALAATQGSPAITLHAGHPVICKTISKDQE